MIYYELTIPIAISVRGRAAGSAAVDSSKEHMCWFAQAICSNLAVICRLQALTFVSTRQPALKKCTQMDQTLSIQWVIRIARSETSWSSKASRVRDRGVGHQDSFFSEIRFWHRFHHVVHGQAINSPPPTLRSFLDTPQDNSTYPFSSRSSIPDRQNMVGRQQSGIRGKKNGILKIYHHRPQLGQIICFDEMGLLPKINRSGKAWGKHVQIRLDLYKSNETVQWFCALNPDTSIALGKVFSTKAAKSCRNFWSEHMLPSWPKGGIHLVMNNLGSHKRALRALPARIRRIQVYRTPTNSSWLNLFESYFASLQSTALHNKDYKMPQEIEYGLHLGVKYLNENSKTYKWK